MGWRKLLALVTALLLLCGCGEKTEDVPEISEEMPEMIEEEVPETPEEPERPAVPPDDDGFADTLLFESGDCTVLVTGCVPEEHALKLWVYNRTADKTLAFTADSGVVNGIMCDPDWTLELEAGTAAESLLRWRADDLADAGVNYLQSVCFRVAAWDRDDPAAAFCDEAVMLHVPGGEGPAVSEVVRPFEEISLVRDERCSVSVVDYRPDGVLGPELLLHLRNMTDEILMVSLDDCVVSGIQCDPMWAFEILPNAETVTTVCWLQDDLDARGIRRLQDVTAMLYVYNSEVVDGPFYVEQQVSFSLSEEEPAVFDPAGDFDEVELAADLSWRVRLRDVRTEADGGLTLVLWIDNRTGGKLRLDASGVTVDGVACEPYWGETVAAGASALAEWNLWPELLQDGGVTAAEEIEFCLTVADETDWTAEPYFDGIVTVKP